MLYSSIWSSYKYTVNICIQFSHILYMPCPSKPSLINYSYNSWSRLSRTKSLTHYPEISKCIPVAYKHFPCFQISLIHNLPLAWDQVLYSLNKLLFYSFAQTNLWIVNTRKGNHSMKFLCDNDIDIFQHVCAFLILILVRMKFHGNNTDLINTSQWRHIHSLSPNSTSTTNTCWVFPRTRVDNSSHQNLQWILKTQQEEIIQTQYQDFRRATWSMSNKLFSFMQTLHFPVTFTTSTGKNKMQHLQFIA